MTEPGQQSNYRQMIRQMGKKEFTLQKMLEYGFWPKSLPTPYEKQAMETEADYQKRKEILKEYDILLRTVTKNKRKRAELSGKLKELGIKYEDIQSIRKEIAKEIFMESKQRRGERKKQRELEKLQRAEAWQKKKKEKIVFIGKGYSSMIHKREVDSVKLKTFGLPIIKGDRSLAELLEIEYKQLRFLAYHRDVVTIDHYIRYKIPKRSGGMRTIAAPMPLLKKTQRKILDEILCLIPSSNYAHGFLKNKSVVTSAVEHPKQPFLLINMDIKDFFPTITFERVRGMFLTFGYSGQISSILALICTYCERTPIEVKGTTRYVATTKRILPQGAPTSPMITNIICNRLDKRLFGLSSKFGFTYTRYADDLSFSLPNEKDINVGKFCGLIYAIIEDEGFKINTKKTRFLRKNNRQEVTGIVINEESLGLPRKWIRQFRAALHNANKVLVKKSLMPEKLYELKGMAAWVKSVNPERYLKLLKTTEEVINKNNRKLKELDKDKSKKSSEKTKKNIKEEQSKKKGEVKHKTIVDFFK